MKLRTKEFLNAFLGLLLLFALLAAIDARAGDKIYQNTEVHTEATAGGGVGEANNDLDIGGDRSESFALGVATSLGAGAIGDCLVTKQESWTIHAKQTFKMNKWCMSVYLDQIGQHETAALMRCSINAMREIFPSQEACVAGNQIVAPDPINLSAVVNLLVKRQDVLNEETTAPLRAEIDNLTETIDNLTKRAERPQARPQTIIQQQPFLDQAKRDALAAIRGDK